jgi:hypothetical protein
MAFSMRCTANNRFEILSDSKRTDRLLAIAFGRKNAELVVEALNRTFGPGEPLQLDLEDVA